MNVIAAYVIPTLFLAFNIAMTIIIFGTINRQYRRIHAWDGEDEDILDYIENKLNSPAVFSSVTLIVGIICDFAFHTGLLPISFVMLIWLIQVVTVHRESIRLENSRK